MSSVSPGGREGDARCRPRLRKLRALVCRSATMDLRAGGVPSIDSVYSTSPAQWRPKCVGDLRRPTGCDGRHVVPS